MRVLTDGCAGADGGGESTNPLLLRWTGPWVLVMPPYLEEYVVAIDQSIPLYCMRCIDTSKPEQLQTCMVCLGEHHCRSCLEVFRKHEAGRVPRIAPIHCDICDRWVCVKRIGDHDQWCDVQLDRCDRCLRVICAGCECICLNVGNARAEQPQSDGDSDEVQCWR